MERNRPKCVTARGPSGRSDSRKRHRRSESPESVPTRIKDKQGSKRHRKVLTIDKDQPRITSFSTDTESESRDENATHLELEANTATQVNMAAPNNDSQFNIIVKEMQKMTEKMEMYMKKMDDRVDMYMKKMDDRVETLESKFTGLEIKQERAEEDIKSLSQDLESNNERIVEMQHAIKIAMSHAERNEQFQRNYNLRIFNLPEKNNETIQDCEQLVLTLFSEQLGIKVPIEAIDNLHRLGPIKKLDENETNRPNDTEKEPQQVDTKERQNQNESNENKTQETTDSQSNVENQETRSNEGTEMETNESDGAAQKSKNNSQSRPVIISFVSRRVRRDVLANRYKLKKKSNQMTAPIIIAEDLTKQRHALFAKARETKDKYKKVWTKDGRVFARQHNGVDVPIDTFSDITNPPVEGRPQRRSYYTPYYSLRGRGGTGRGNFRSRGAYPGAHPRFYGPGGNVYYNPWGQGQGGFGGPASSNS